MVTIQRHQLHDAAYTNYLIHVVTFCAMVWFQTEMHACLPILPILLHRDYLFIYVKKLFQISYATTC